MELNLIFFLVLLSYAFSQTNEGDLCTDQHTNRVGLCKRVEQCRSAEEELRLNGIPPTFCLYTFDSSIVCCRDGGSILQTDKPKTTTELKGIQPTFCLHTFDTSIVCCRDGGSILQTDKPKTTTEPSKPIWGRSDDRLNSRRVSERKCDEYSRGVVATVDFTVLLPKLQPMTIEAAKCDYTVVELIVGGENASLGEFPHMAAIGWANNDGYNFNCGGSLISPRFVLTAGHCTNDPRAQNPLPVVVRLGDQNIDPAVQDGASPVEVPIRNIHRHPEYEPPVRYNDIALLELAADINFEARIRPACLWTSPNFDSLPAPPNRKGIATGWGVTNNDAKIQSTELQKVSLSILENYYCDLLLEDDKNRNWNGFRATQVCAGELRGGRDTCQGDSGSPLQVASKDNQCIFHIIGVTSFGRECAKSGQPGIYTRVSSYLDWIEETVWPGEQ